jgi:hypothetical protein
VRNWRPGTETRAQTTRLRSRTNDHPPGHLARRNVDDERSGKRDRESGLAELGSIEVGKGPGATCSTERHDSTRGMQARHERPAGKARKKALIQRRESLFKYPLWTCDIRILSITSVFACPPPVMSSHSACSNLPFSSLYIKGRKICKRPLSASP